jgi:predicted nucleic acid-binding protein
LEESLYEAFFSGVSHWASDLEEITHMADRIACTYGLAGMDALHIAAALSISADEFVTTEKSTKPMHRVTEIRVLSIIS